MKSCSRPWLKRIFEEGRGKGGDRKLKGGGKHKEEWESKGAIHTLRGGMFFLLKMHQKYRKKNM